ncbi:hypothetical protein [Kitasatospora herbaricolor]|uniref:hypothetical protein n=1 Tax=Kitasatospora herbaricolor TaxID=68217 RepID=UPI0036DE875A
MTDSLTTAAAGTDPAEVRAERRRLVQAVAAHRRLLAGRPGFERADLRRRNREVRARTFAQQKHDAAVRRADGKHRRAQSSCDRRLAALDGSRDSRESQALAALRRQFIDGAIGKARLTPEEVNGIGGGLVRDLAAQGICTPADFTRISYAKAPNGRGGTVVWIHRTRGGKVHINGIGEHRARTLMEWRTATLAGAEARAPQKLPVEERLRVDQIIADERVHLQREKEEAERAVSVARVVAGQVLAETLVRLAAAESGAGAAAVLRRAEFDAMAERLLALQAELRLHMDRNGTVRSGFRLRRAEARVLRPVPHLPQTAERPFVPSPRAPMSSAPPHRGGAAATDEAASPGRRAHLLWLLPIGWFTLTMFLGFSYRTAGPLWAEVAVRLVSLATVVWLLCLWVPRRRVSTAQRMPTGSALATWGVFVGLSALRASLDPAEGADGVPWFGVVLSAALLLWGVARRRA